MYGRGSGQFQDQEHNAEDGGDEGQDQTALEAGVRGHVAVGGVTCVVVDPHLVADGGGMAGLFPVGDMIGALHRKADHGIAGVLAEAAVAAVIVATKFV